jgi:RHS repeat-associated protein
MNNAMQNYNHNYVYDKLGNMLSDAWKTNNYATANNYLLGHNNLTNQYAYDAHGNMLMMPHLSNLGWDYLDQLHSATNGTFVSYYNYDAEGNRTRKVVIKGNIREERYYIGGYEIYRKYTNNSLDFERTTLNISDNEKVFVRIEQKTNENEIVRYQYDNHLGSACLELDANALIISYEEYHPFGTTSYRSGRNEVEVSLKRYKYCGKERDEETGMYYYGARYYVTWLCRFISVDPLQFDYPQLTSYNYAGNKPITHIDIEGMQSSGDEPRPDIYTVQKGDSPSSIAGKFNISIWDLAKNNQGVQTGGGFFTSIGTGNYNEYWVEGKGTTWSLQPGDILNINPISEQALYQTPSFLSDSEMLQLYRPLATGAAYSVGLLDPFIDMLSEGISFLLQKVGLSEKTSDISAGIIVAGGSLIVSKKTPSFGNKTPNLGWKVGSPITNLTSKGNVPAWSTVRQRYWKNEAFLMGKIMT